MRISVFGLGYVGIVSAACLARDGHRVIGVDPQPEKVALVRDGRSPIIEKGVGELIAEAVQDGRLTAVTSAAEAVAQSDLSFVCVGTPSRRNGSLDTSAVERVCEDIGAAMRSKDTPHLVVIRSTILPGTMRGLVLPALERAAGMPVGDRLKVANNPEFLREFDGRLRLRQSAQDGGGGGRSRNRGRSAGALRGTAWAKDCDRT